VGFIAPVLSSSPFSLPLSLALSLSLSGLVYYSFKRGETIMSPPSNRSRMGRRGMEK
jgi:hypothetical protein